MFSMMSPSRWWTVNTGVVSLLRACEKMFAKNAMYAKGDTVVFESWMKTYHRNTYLFPLARACGGSRQDLGVEGTSAVLWNIKYYVPYLHWRLTCGAGDNILRQNLFILLRSVEVIALLRVLSILYYAICLPVRWLSGNTAMIGDEGFAALDMGKVLDLMEDAFIQISRDGKLLLDEDFMMNIFASISEKVPSFADYLAHMFEERESRVPGSKKKLIPLDLIRAELFYPKRKEICQTFKMSVKLAEEAAAVFLVEFRDPKKATSHYLSSINGQRSQAIITEEERLASLGLHSDNSVSESGHALATRGYETWGTLRIDRATGEGAMIQGRWVHRGHEALISGRKGKHQPTEREFGDFHKLPFELKQSLIQTARENVAECKKNYDEALVIQREAKREKEEIALQHKLNKAEDQLIEATYYYEQYHSPRCWRTKAVATREFKALPNKTQKMRYIREQIQMRYVGLGWDKAGHAWSESGTDFSAEELFDHFINTVIPLTKTEMVPPQPPLNWPTPPELYTLGAMGDHAKDLHDSNVEAENELREKASMERDRREAEEGKKDQWEKRQQIRCPTFNKRFVGFRIEMLFEFTESDGTTYVDWCHGVVTGIVNQVKSLVKIKWNEEFVLDGEPDETIEPIPEGKWNPNKPKKGAWRQYLTD